MTNLGALGSGVLDELAGDDEANGGPDAAECDASCYSEQPRLAASAANFSMALIEEHRDGHGLGGAEEMQCLTFFFLPRRRTPPIPPSPAATSLHGLRC